MEKPATKEQLLALVHAERTKLDKKVAGLSPEEMCCPASMGDWSVKDLLAHLVDWEQRLVNWYETGLRGDLPHLPAPGFNWSQLPALNQQGYQHHKQRPLSDVLADYLASHQQLLALIEGMTEEEIFEIGRYAWTGKKSSLAVYIAANTYKHYAWAAKEIRPKRIRQALAQSSAG